MRTIAAAMGRADGLLTRRSIRLEEALNFSGFRCDGSSPMARLDGETLAARFFQQSSWATHTVALGRQVVKVPDGIDADLMGPLGCSISRGAGTILDEMQPRLWNGWCGATPSPK